MHRFLAVLFLLPFVSAFIPLKEGNIKAFDKVSGNMNGEYKLQPTPKQAKNASWSTNFTDYPGGLEYIEVYFGPITSTYSEVFWTELPEVQLPDSLIKRFEGKGIAVVGIEADQVRRTADGDISVPINMAYNHHYGGRLLGKGSRMEKVLRNSSRPETMHPGPDPEYAYLPVEVEPSKLGLPTSFIFGYSNGGEFRKTYRGLLPPFAQVVDSPTRFQFSPMQIDTWNRDKMDLNGSAFVAGPAPKNSFAPVTGVDAIYSGLLECPWTTRIRKHITGGGWNDSVAAEIYQMHARCATAPATASACFRAAAELPGLDGVTISTSEGSSSVIPPQCTIARGDATHASVFFNTNNDSKVFCGAGVAAIEGEADMTKEGGARIALSVENSDSATAVSITLAGPDGVWFGVGFDTDAMANSPYAIIVDGSGQLSERTMGNHQPGVQISDSLAVVSSSVSGGVRTVKMTRALKGSTPQHHTFVATKMSIPLISAVGSTPTISYHKSKTVGGIYMWPKGGDAACVCTIAAAPFGSGTGTLEYLPTGEVIGFPFRCRRDESIFQSRNPTCDIRTYAGGLSTCHHGWHLLDADQEVPWADQPLEYWMKFRFYFQELDTHVVAVDGTWGIGGDTGEYDVPQCSPGTPVEDCKHEIEGMITPGGTDLHFVAAHYHCHAPTCLSLEIWNNKTGELICKEEPYHGRGADLNKGGDKFDEEGYIAQRICLWGDRDGFEKPPLVSGVPLYVKAVTNNTYGHHGEMALPQMLMASLPV